MSYSKFTLTNHLITTTTTSDNPTISTIKIPQGEYSIKSAREDEIFEEIKKIKEKMSMSIKLVHNCANCGATLQIEERKPIFHCKYCDSVYLIGPVQLYSNY